MKTRKAKYEDWKTQFAAKSQVPLIENDDPQTVMMPYIENVNAFDALRNNKEISDFGACDWAKDLNLEKKYELSQKIVQELSSLHSKGVTWGEAILPNILLTKEQQVVFVDPENSYDENVPLPEQKARDLKQLLFSLAGGLTASEGVTDF